MTQSEHAPHRPQVLVTFLGDPTPRTAGNLERIRQMLHYLCNAGLDVTFYSYTNAPSGRWTRETEASFYREFPTIRRVTDEWNGLLGWVTRFKNNATAFFPSATKQILGFSVPGLTPNWRRLIKTLRPKIILINYAMNAGQLNGVDLSKCVVETHDLEFWHISLSKGHPLWHWDTLRRLRREIAILDNVKVVISIARTELYFHEAMLPAAETCYLPPLVASRPVERRHDPQYDLLFIGNTTYKNVDGINSFLRAVRGWRRTPSLAIAGTVGDLVAMPPDLASRVTTLGYVEDLQALYASARLAICPVVGTGVNMKIFEALAFGRPVLACRPAISALPPGSEECVFELSERTAEHFLTNEAALASASRAASAYVDSPQIKAYWATFVERLRKLAAEQAR